MHPKNPYELHPPSFKKLAELWPPLAPFVRRTLQGKGAVDFTNPDAAREVTRATLKRDFDLVVDLPADRLCPGVPGRLDYVLWVRDILESMSDADPQRIPLGVDIGTGASAIYPLLAMSTLAGSCMVGTEIDDVSVKAAKVNVDRNGDLLATLNQPNVDPARTFVMCNPPFYASRDEMATLAAQKDSEPYSISTGADVEVVCEGGEVGFIGRIVDESAATPWRDSIRWFTSLCGRLSSVGKTVDHFKGLGGNNYGIYQISHSQTKRWLVAWSWQDHRLPDNVGRMAPSSPMVPLPVSTSFSTFCGEPDGLDHLATAVEAAIAHAGLAVQVVAADVDPPRRTYRLSAAENTWSRAGRRKRARGEIDLSPTRPKALRVDLTLDIAPSPLPRAQQEPADGADEEPKKKRKKAKEEQGPLRTRLTMQWVFGRERIMVESLWTALIKQVLSPSTDDAMQT